VRGPAPSSAVVAFDLAQLELGARARVTAVTGDGALALRLLEMGFTPGAVVVLVKRAPFGDPLELQVRGCHVSLRRAEAARIEAVPL
jgi:ferrous iron transport protein A